MYERCICNQMQQYSDNILANYQCYNSQDCLITIIKKWRESVDKGGAV